MTEPNAPLSIPRTGKSARAADPLGFWALRALAVERAQAASGLRWTDYNLHDPGVTLIEAFCYALTELTYRFDFPVADHLGDALGQIDWHRQALLPPEQAYPSRATTIEDFRRLLFDGDRTLRDLKFGVAGAAMSGLYRLALLTTHPHRHQSATERAQRTYRAQRTIGEDLADGIPELAVDYQTLMLAADVDAEHDPIDIAAAIFDVCERALSATPVHHDVDALSASGLSLDQILTGPLNRHGLTDTAPGPESLSISPNALRSRLVDVGGIRSIESLTLASSPTAPTGTANDAAILKLLLPSRENSPEQNRAIVANIQLFRRGERVFLAADEVTARFDDRRRGERNAVPVQGTGIAPLPTGHRPVAPPRQSIAALFPPLYRLADDGDRAPSDPPTQFQVYLALIDQVIANGMAQLDHVGELFSGALHDRAGRPVPGHRRAALDDAIVPGIANLVHSDAASSSARLLLAYGITRRNAALDYLLALYGEVLVQDTQARLAAYLDRPERDFALLENKAAYLGAIESISRDRTGGFDYGKPLWETAAAATPGFQQRVALLLGFADARARRLTGPLLLQGEAQAAPIDGATVRLTWPLSAEPHLTAAEARRSLHFEQVPPELLLSLAVDRARYRWADDILYLTVEGGAAGWQLATCPARSAARLATWLRHHALLLTKACEGIHVVEQILLRSRTTNLAASDARPASVTIILPSWTGRTANPEFRAFATEVALRNCPAHVSIECRWPTFDAMVEFERDFADWASILRDHTAGVVGGDKLDQASAGIARLVAAMPRDEAPQAAW